MTLGEEVKAVLADRAAPLPALVKAVSAGEKALAEAPETAIGLSANVTIDLLGLFLRREALLAGQRARIVAGGYDDPVGDVERFAAEGVERMLLVPFFDNLLPSFEAQAAVLGEEAVEAKLAEVRARLALALDRASGFKSVWIALAHRFGAAPATGSDAAGAAIERFNALLRAEAEGRPNVQLVEIGSLAAELGRAAAYDGRFYFRSKAPYSAALLSALAARLARVSRGFGAWFYKALALDCDNTLWGGIIGEDLVEGIKLGPYDAPGNIFWRVQQTISGLEKQGLILCLCTKNNPADVEEVFKNHPEMVLKDGQIAARRVNWNDKVSNLQSLAEELNIGLDSFIFLDDNPVEAEAVRTRLPMVRMIEVPAALPDYPRVVEEIAELYLAGGVSADSRSKTEQYRQRAAAAEAKSAFASHEEYLASLGLEVELHVDRPAEAPRISELSMKSNQFNLTTERWDEGAVRGFMAAQDAEIVSVTVRNKFGNSGLTGIVLLRFDGEVARVGNFLMSCRVLGQGVEFSLWNVVAARCRARGCTRIEAEYRPSAKNAQVADFYDRLGLTPIGDEGRARRYGADLAAFDPHISSWIRVIHD
jgi:FkbH-like protein